MSEWKQIETAPKDGTEILLLSRSGEIANARWTNDKGGYWLWWPYRLSKPIWWMPLPMLPRMEA